MRDMPSRFIEILDPEDSHFPDQEALASRPRSSTQSSTKAGLDKDRIYREGPSSPQQRWKRLSTILVPARRGSN
ncbi:hypothetical protein NYO67_11023 [Aspergillus flavus]|nr:hypothetical protein NYO67_11023 [Aspergillus flavus]